MSLRSLLSLSLALALSGCMVGNQTGLSGFGRTGLEVQRVASVVVSEGTSRVMGTVRLPASLLDGTGASLDAPTFVTSGRLTLLDADGQPIPQTEPAEVDAQGGYSFPAVPLGVSMVLRAEIPVGDRTLVLKKLIRATDALTCAHVDLATTLVADKLFSATPLVKPDPGLAGADLFELFHPARLLGVEAHFRQRLDLAPPPSLEDVRDALVAGDTSGIFNLVEPLATGSGDAYHDMFERPDSSLDIRISAVGTNSVPIKERPKVFGVLRFKVLNAPEGIARIEYWAKSSRPEKVAEASDTPDFLATWDSWTLPDGDYTFDTIAVFENNRRRLLGQTFVRIENTIGNHCPLP